MSCMIPSETGYCLQQNKKVQLCSNYKRLRNTHVSQIKKNKQKIQLKDICYIISYCDSRNICNTQSICRKFTQTGNAQWCIKNRII